MSRQLLPGPPVRKLPGHTTTLSYLQHPWKSPPEQRGRLPWQWCDLTDDALRSKRDAVNDEGAPHSLPQSLDALNHKPLTPN